MIETHKEFQEGYRYTFSKKAYLQAVVLNENTDFNTFRYDGADKLAWYNWLDGYKVSLKGSDGYITYYYQGNIPQEFLVASSWCIPEKISRGVE